MSQFPAAQASIAESHEVTRLALVTNIPVPYREPVLEALAREPDLDLRVFYCSDSEPDRNWRLPASAYKKTILRERFVTISGRFVHINLDIVPALLRFSPNIVVTTGFNPTHLLAYAYAKLFGRVHIVMSDGTLESEERLTNLHRTVRRIVYRGSRAFIGASEGTRRLYESYGLDPSAMFKSALCADNDRFSPASSDQKKVDLLFCGRMVEDKCPLFALAVAQQVGRRLGRRVSIVFVGSGPQEGPLRNAAAAAASDVDARFVGFVQHDDLPKLYREARVFLFPSRWDPWGVVANEAAASGLPVIVTPNAGAANELIVHEHNGYVLPLDLTRWADAATAILTNSELRTAMSQRARAMVGNYTFTDAAAAIAMAARACFALGSMAPPTAIAPPTAAPKNSNDR